MSMPRLVKMKRKMNMMKTMESADGITEKMELKSFSKSLKRLRYKYNDT
jgi:hypothetical protein